MYIGARAAKIQWAPRLRRNELEIAGMGCLGCKRCTCCTAWSRERKVQQVGRLRDGIKQERAPLDGCFCHAVRSNRHFDGYFLEAWYHAAPAVTVRRLLLAASLHKLSVTSDQGLRHVGGRLDLRSGPEIEFASHHGTDFCLILVTKTPSKSDQFGLNAFQDAPSPPQDA